MGVISTSLLPLGALAIALLCAGARSPAVAQTEMIDSAFSTCGTINCDTTSVAGFIGTSAPRIVPWTAKILSEAGNCLRVEMSFIRAASADLEMTIVAPNALTRYRNDDGGTCANCPLVKISPAPQTGYYTVVVSTDTGAAADTDFHILFGQYQAGNLNCTSPTPPLP